MKSSSPMPVVFHGVPSSRVDPALAHASHVFLRVDAVRRPLVPPYEGPFPVISRTAKTFVILRREKPVTVTIDRLKPAASLPESLTVSPPSSPPALAAPLPAVPPRSYAAVAAKHVPPSPPTPKPTRSGRVPRPIRRFQS